MDFTGVIIEESLEDKSVLKDLRILSTKVVPVTERHQTPWVRQWTLHSVEIPADKAVEIAKRVGKALEHEHQWYADYKNDTEHYIIYRGNTFHITNRADKSQYDAATQYGISVGIPEYQVDFSAHVQQSKP